MGTTAEKLQNIINVKNALSGIIADKGETVPARFADYPAKLQPADTLTAFSAQGYAGDIRSNMADVGDYGLYGLKCTGSVYLPRVATAGRNAFTYAEADVLHVENLTTLTGQNAFTQTKINTLRADRLSTVTSGTGQFQYSDAKTMYVGWQGVNGSVDQMTLAPSIAAAALWRNCAKLETLYLGRILTGTSVGTNNKFTGCVALRTIYCGSNSPDTLQPYVSSGWTIPTPANCTIYCWVQEELKWYQFTWDGSAYTYAEMSDTSGMPPIPGL